MNFGEQPPVLPESVEKKQETEMSLEDFAAECADYLSNANVQLEDFRSRLESGAFSPRIMSFYDYPYLFGEDLIATGEKIGDTDNIAKIKEIAAELKGTVNEMTDKLATQGTSRFRISVIYAKIGNPEKQAQYESQGL